MISRIVAGLALLASITHASAAVEFYFTGSNSGYGAVPADLAFKPTLDVPPSPTTGDDYLHYAMTGAVPTFQPNAPFNPASGEWLYVWLRFDGTDGDVSVQGMELVVGPADKVEQVAYYIMDNEGKHGPDEKRWDGGVEYFKTNPVILAAVHAKGLRPSLHGILAEDPLYVGTARTALLGAVRMAPDTTVVTFGLGSLGMQWTSGTTPTTVFGGAYAVPEPATLVPLVVAGLLRCRRR